MAAVSVGTKAPGFSLPTGDDRKISLKDFKGKKVVLYFYPKDDTSGCTREACSFRDNLNRVKKKGAVVLGVSPDSSSSHKKFSEKYDLTFPLISDEDRALANAYGVWKEKNFLGKKYMGVERTTFIIDERGYIAHIFPRVKVDGHVDEVLSHLG